MLLGCLNCLMAATDDLGYPNASEELIRAGWAYAIAIDHKPLMAKLRLIFLPSPTGVTVPGRPGIWPAAA